MNWTDFLKFIADEYQLFNDKRNIFLSIFSEKNFNKSITEIPKEDYYKSEKTIQRYLTKIYEAFSVSVSGLSGGKKDKRKILKNWLDEEYIKRNKPQDAVDTNDINWHEILNSENLNDYLKLRKNATKKDFELDIYVPLGLIERKEQQRRPLNQDLEVDQVYQLPEKEEITRKFEHQEFLNNIGLGNKPEDDNKNIAIIGEPGAGKTTLLDKLAHLIHSKNKGLPICISLANLEENQTLQDYLENKWLKNILSKRTVSEDIKEELSEQFNNNQNGGVWLLLDGLDEMKATSPVAALKNIKQYINESYLSKARVIISCRVNLWDAFLTNPLSDFTTYINLDFTESDRNKFIREWFKRQDKNDLADSLIGKLQEIGKERIGELVKNPLRLVLLCEIWTVNQGELPETKFQFYQGYLPSFYDWKKEIINLTDNVDKQNELHNALGKLAEQGIDSQSRYRIKQSDAEKIMGEELFKLANELGWLNIVDRELITNEAVYAFYHPTFQEYFAALAINDWDFFLPKEHIEQPVANKKYRIFDPKWKEVILLWIGRDDLKKEEKEKFIKALVQFKEVCKDWENPVFVKASRKVIITQGFQHLLKKLTCKNEILPKDFYFYRAYFLAAVAIDQFKDCSVADKIVEEIVNWSVGKKTFYFISESAYQILPETDRERAIATLIKIIDSADDELIRSKVAECLGKIDSRNSKAIAALIDIIRTPKNTYTCFKAAESLGKIGQGNSKAIAFLIDIFRTPENEEIRWIVADCLGKIVPPNDKAINVLIEALIELFWDSQDYNTRIRVADYLGQIGRINKTAIDFLIKLIYDSGCCDTIEIAAKSLGKIDRGNRKAIDALIELIKNWPDDCINNRILPNAAKSLGEIGQGTEDEINALIDLINKYRHHGILLNAAESLGKIGKGSKNEIDALIYLINNYKFDDYIQIAAAASLGKIDPRKKEAINALIYITKNSNDEQIRWYAAENLGNIDQNNCHVFTTLIEIIKTSQSQNTLRLVADSLEKIIQYEQMPEVIKELKEYLSDEMLEHHRYRFESCYTVIWKCAQTLTYPEFYQAWHS